MIRNRANKESLVEVTGLKESSFLNVFFDGMKVVIWLRIERAQRIIAHSLAPQYYLITHIYAKDM